jgi:putative tryptophan/tyrosine transport system substrate-binding protein
MIERRKLMIALGGLAIGAPLAAHAQQPVKPTRIAVLASGNPETTGYLFDAFIRRLRELGYVEGKDVVYETRWALGKLERLPELARELVALQPDLIFTGTGTVALVARQATTQIPIVFAFADDPVASGLAKSLARPGGNVTGLSSLASDTSPKLLELLLAVVPKLSRLAVLSQSTDPTTTAALKNLRIAAQSVNVNVITFEASTPAEIESAFARLAREHADAVFVSNSILFLIQRRQIADLALSHRIASIAGIREFPESGCLMNYGQNIADNFRGAATYVDKILKGAKPGDLPVEQATRFELVINLKTAKALGLTIPASLRLRADEVIE